MPPLSHFFYKKSTLAIAIGLTVITFSYLWLVFIDQGKCFEAQGDGPASLGTSFGFGYDAVKAFLGARTPDMIACYQTFNLVWDNLFALLYGLMYVSWVSFLLKPYRNKVLVMNLLPFAQTILDWLENVQLSGIADSYLSDGEISTQAVQWASITSQAKWVVSTVVFGIILTGIVLRIVKAISRKQGKGE